MESEFFSDKLFFLNLSRRELPLIANKKKDLVRIELKFLQEVSIIVRLNMKPRLYFYTCLLIVISKQQK